MEARLQAGLPQQELLLLMLMVEAGLSEVEWEVELMVPVLPRLEERARERHRRSAVLKEDKALEWYFSILNRLYCAYRVQNIPV